MLWLLLEVGSTHQLFSIAQRLRHCQSDVTPSMAVKVTLSILRLSDSAITVIYTVCHVWSSTEWRYFVRLQWTGFMTSSVPAPQSILAYNRLIGRPWGGKGDQSLFCQCQTVDYSIHLKNNPWSPRLFVNYLQVHRLFDQGCSCRSVSVAYRFRNPTGYSHFLQE